MTQDRPYPDEIPHGAYATIELHQPDAESAERRERARDAFISRILGQLRERR